MSLGYKIIAPTIDYNELEQIISPHHFSIRVTPEPLELHWRGIEVRRFPNKRALVDYLNRKIHGRIAA